MKREDLQRIMQTAWQFVKRNGFTMAEALKQAWLNFKLKTRMAKGIVKFYFQKVDGSIREAWGTLAESLVPQTKGTGRKMPDTCQVYFDSEVNDWRCYKIANLIKIA